MFYSCVLEDSYVAFQMAKQCCYLIEAYLSNNKSFRETHRLLKEKTWSLHCARLDNQQNCAPVSNQTHNNTHEGQWEADHHYTGEERVGQGTNCPVSVHPLPPCVNLSQATLHHVLYSPKLKLYRISIRQGLQPAVYIKCIWLREWLQCFSHAGASHFDSVYFSDQAQVHLDGYVNFQNYCFWYSENQHEFVESGLHPEKIDIRSRILKKKIVGPSFFETTIIILLAIKKLFKVLSQIWMGKADSTGFNKIVQLRILLLQLWTFWGSFSICKSFQKTYGLFAALIYDNLTSSHEATWKTEGQNQRGQ